LELLGNFERSADYIQRVLNGDAKDRPEIILGITDAGKKITLVNCLNTRTNYSSVFGVETSAYLPHFVIVGKHFNKASQINIDEYWVRFSHLGDWVAQSGFKYEYRLKEGRGVNIDYSNPEQIVLYKKKGLAVSLAFTFECIPPSATRTEVFLKQETHMVVKKTQERHYTAYMDVVSQLQNFVALGVLSPVLTQEVSGVIRGNKGQKTIVDIYYGTHDVPVRKKPIHPRDMLFYLGDVKGKSHRIIGAWLDAKALLKPVMDLYFSLLNTSFAYDEQKFLGIVQAIESYHRRRYGGTELPDEEHQRRIREILDGVPGEYKSWLKQRLSHSNEIGLKPRILYLRSRNCRLIERFLSEKEVAIAYDTRNYLTHYDRRLENKSARGFELVKLTEKLRMLLEICFLEEVGFTSDEIDTLVMNSERFQSRIRYVSQ
jgi:hypothetical protein